MVAVRFFFSFEKAYANRQHRHHFVTFFSKLYVFVVQIWPVKFSLEMLTQLKDRAYSARRLNDSTPVHTVQLLTHVRS